MSKLLDQGKHEECLNFRKNLEFYLYPTTVEDQEDKRRF